MVMSLRVWSPRGLVFSRWPGLGVGWRQGVRGCESVDSQIAPLKSAALTGLEGELDAARKGKHVLTEVRDLFQT